MSGKAALASFAAFAAVWGIFLFLMQRWPADGWLLDFLIDVTLPIAFVSGIASGAYVDTRRKDK